MPKVYNHLFSAINEISVECRQILEHLGEQDATKIIKGNHVLILHFGYAIDSVQSLRF
jgi:hypothetical protein